MPAGTPPEKVEAAVRNFAREEFALKHRYAFVLHPDEPHPHVHLLLKAMSEQGVRLNIKKATLQQLLSRAFANGDDRGFCSCCDVSTQVPPFAYPAAVQVALSGRLDMPGTMYRKKSGIRISGEPGSTGEFTDIQTSERGQGQDVKRPSAPARAAAKKKSSKKKSGQKKTAKKSARKK